MVRIDSHRFENNFMNREVVRSGSVPSRFVSRPVHGFIRFHSVRFLSGLTALLLFIKEVYAVLCIAALKLYPLVFVHMKYIQQDDPATPLETFGGKHCFPGVAENEYSRTALASKFSFGMERLSKYCNSLYTCSILNRTIPQPLERHFWGQTLLSGGC